MVGAHDVSTLMTSRFSGHERNAFGREEDTRLPLLLPKVMEGVPLASKSPLLSLPPEILGDIMDLLLDDESALSALALVNSDCRQLARSCQFADVCFDYGPRSNQLRWHLLREACARHGHDTPGTVIRPPYIGSCIRRVTVRSQVDLVIEKHRELHDSIWGDSADSITSEEHVELRKAAADYYFGKHFAAIIAAVRVGMPHLETFSWHDAMCLDEDFFRHITQSPIRHLKLSRGHISNPHCLDSLPPFAMSLQTLHLDVSVCDDERHENDTTKGNAIWETTKLSPFIKALLQRCSTTLERLYLRGLSFPRDVPLSFGPEQVTLGRLRHLNLSGCYDYPDTVAWSSLLSAPLRHLALPPRSSPSFIQSISACQPLRDLETLVLPSLSYDDATAAHQILDFLSRHCHVRKLSVLDGEQQVMDSYLVPLLSDGRWSNLTSLSLAWRGPGISEETAPNIATISAESLAAIGSIASLEQLCLSAGEPIGWAHQWLIDHELVRSSLRGLTKLKRLAFSRDTYNKPGLSNTIVESYYEYRFVTPEEQDIAMERPYLDGLGPNARTDEGSNDGGMSLSDMNFNEGQLWERAHRNRMLREAESYARTLPSLEWIYCGQWPMGFRSVPTSKGIRRISEPLSKERDSCSTLLGQLFAMGEDDDD